MAADGAGLPRALSRLAAAVVTLPGVALIAAVRAYRLVLKPWVGNACRFEPSCSAYTLQVLQQHGASAGVLLGGWRLLRCQPWCEGGCDPVPEHHPLRGLFTRFTAADAPPADRPDVADPLSAGAPFTSSSRQSPP